MRCWKLVVEVPVMAHLQDMSRSCMVHHVPQLDAHCTVNSNLYKEYMHSMMKCHHFSMFRKTSLLQFGNMSDTRIKSLEDTLPRKAWLPRVNDIASELEIGNLSTVADEFVDPSHLTGAPYLWGNCLLVLLYHNTAAATYDTVNLIAARRSTRFQNLCVLLCHQWVLLWGYHLHLAHNIKYNTQMLYPNTVTNIKTLEPAAWMTG